MRKRGFQLVELIVALTVLGVVSVLLVNLLTLPGLTVQRTTERADAGNIAQSMLERRWAMGYDALIPGSRELDPLDRGGTVYRRSIEVEAVEPHAYRVRATVRWTVRGNERTVFREAVMSEVNR